MARVDPGRAMTIPAKHPNGGQSRHLMVFRRYLSQVEDPGGLLHSALLISSIQFAELENEWWRPWVEKIDRLAEEVKPLLPPIDQAGEVGRLEVFVRCFCHDLGFAGNTEDYHAPENSCLTHVLASRRGLPITLSVVMISLGDRLGFKFFGVGAPGHFLTGVHIGAEIRYMDPFSGAELFSLNEAAQLIAVMINQPVAQVRPYLTQSSNREILIRMLNNLKMSYMGRGEMKKLLVTLDWLLALEPDNLVELRNRGLILLREGETSRGAADLLRYVDEATDPDDIALIQREALKAMKGGR